MQNKLNRTAIWCAALTIAIVLDQWKHLFPGQYTLLAGAEPIRQAYSWFTFWCRSIHDGSWPLWDPNSWGGYAFPGEMQTAAFYPLYLVLLLFRPNRFGLFPVPLYTGLFMSAHIMAALFMFAFMRHLRVSRLAAFVAGFAFSSGSFTGAVTWPHMLQSAIWLPLIALFLFRALEREKSMPGVRNALLAGLFLGLSFLAGGLHIAMAQSIFVVSATGYYSRRARSLVPMLLGALVLVSGIGVAAIQLLPSHLYAQHSLRAMGGIAVLSASKPPYTFLTHDALSPRALMSFLFPSFEDIGTGEIWTPYVGVLPFLFAVLGTVKLWSKPWVPYFVSLALAVFLYSLAGVSALHGVLYLITPFLWMAREATRFLYLTGFCVCILAAFGLDYFCSALAQQEFFPTLKHVLRILMGGCAVLFVAAVFVPKIGGHWEYFSLLLLLMSCALLYAATVRLDFRAGPSFRFLLLFLLFFDLNAFNWTGINKLEGPSAGTEDIDILNSLKGAAGYLRTQPGPFRVKVDYEPPPNIGDAYGVPSLAGGGVTIDRYAWRALPLIDLLNVTYVVRPASSPAAGAIYQDKYWKVYRNSNAFPHSWIVHRLKVEPNDEAMHDDTQSAGADLRNVALLASAPEGPVGPLSQPGSDMVRIASYSARRIQVIANTSAPGFLVLSDIYYPEWRATLNGREVKIIRTDEALRGISLPAGQSTILFSYQPTTVYTGASISLLTCLLIAAVCYWPVRI